MRGKSPWRQLARPIVAVGLAATGCAPRPSAAPPASIPASPPLSPSSPDCEPPPDKAVVDGLALRGQSPDCEEPGACATELVEVRNGCVIASWKPPLDDAVITSFAAADNFSPPMLALEWVQEADRRKGIDALVRQGDALVRVDGIELATLVDDMTTCAWAFILPSDPDGRDNRILALGRCETWAPSPPGEPSFAPLESERSQTWVWDGTALALESEG